MILSLKLGEHTLTDEGTFREGKFQPADLNKPISDGSRQESFGRRRREERGQERTRFRQAVGRDGRTDPDHCFEYLNDVEETKEGATWREELPGKRMRNDIIMHTMRILLFED